MKGIARLRPRGDRRPVAPQLHAADGGIAGDGGCDAQRVSPLARGETRSVYRDAQGPAAGSEYEQYASIMELGGVSRPLLVTSFDGRPIKIEGNPSHPFSWTVEGKIGSADAMAQASVLELYDPDRSRGCALWPSMSNCHTRWPLSQVATMGSALELPGRAPEVSEAVSTQVRPRSPAPPPRPRARRPAAPSHEPGRIEPRVHRLQGR